MRIPRYYRKPGWQRFFAGLFLGVLGGWMLFFQMYGYAHEQQVEKIEELRAKIEELKQENEQLVKDHKEKNRQLERQLTIQNIEIKWQKPPRLTDSEQQELKNAIKEQLSPLINTDINSVSESRSLIYLIENKDYVIDREHYEVEIKELVILSSTLEIIIAVKKKD